MPAMKKATNYFENLTEMMSWYLKMVAVLVSLRVSVYIRVEQRERKRGREACLMWISRYLGHLFRSKTSEILFSESFHFSYVNQLHGSNRNNSTNDICVINIQRETSHLCSLH